MTNPTAAERAAALRHELECGRSANTGCEKCAQAEAAFDAFDAALAEAKGATG